jgi:NitT/TauT family transport system substrate-binding protein
MRVTGYRQAVAGIAAIIVGCVWIGSASAQGAKVAVRAAYAPAITWLPAWVAKDKGFFDAKGLDVSLMPVTNLASLPGTLGKQIDIAPSTPIELIQGAARGLQIVAVAGGAVESTANQPIQLMVRKESGIAKPSDLKGKLIATPSLGGIMHIATLYWLKNSGIESSAVRSVEVPFPNMMDQLKAERIDAAEAIQPFVDRMKTAGYVSIGDPVLAIANPAHIALWIANNAWARANKPTIEAWIAALKEAKAFIDTNPAETLAIVAKYTRLPEEVVKQLSISHYDTAIEPGELTLWVKALRKLGLIPRDVDAATLILK